VVLPTPKKKPRRLTGLFLTLVTKALPTRNFWGYGQVLWGRRKTTANQAKSSNPKQRAPNEADAPTGRQFDLPYMVEQWDDSDSHVEELIALTGDYRVARAAYEEAVKRRPGRIVTLRQKTRLLADNREK
jgi:hypothetical protein